jgi:hypothetical protein
MTDETMPEAAAPPHLEPEDVASDPDRHDERAGQEPGDLTLALSPRQILGGFALLAAAVVLLRRRGRTGRDSKG